MIPFILYELQFDSSPISLSDKVISSLIYPTIDTKVMNNVICFFVSLSINMLCILHFAIIFGFNKDNIGLISLLLL